MKNYIIIKTGSYLKSLIVPKKELGLDILQFWREIILRSLLALCVVAGAIIAIPTIILQINQGLWHLLFVTLSVYSIALTIFLFNQIPYKIRAVLVLILIYSMGVGISFSVGLYSGAPFWFFSFSILAALMLNRNIAIISVIINAISLIVIYFILNSEIISVKFNHITNSAVMFLAWTSFILLNAITSISTSVLVNILVYNVDKERINNQNLQKEKEKLINIANDLDFEIKSHKLTEGILAESEEKHRLIAENIGDVIWIVDMDLNYTYISPVATKLHGWLPEELSELKISDFLTPESIDKAIKNIGHKLQVGNESGNFNKSSTLELEMYRKDGTKFNSEITASFLLDSNNNPISILGVTRDITPREKALEEKKKLEEQLQAAKKMESLALLAGGVAHDLNNILSGIVSYPDLLLLDMSDDNPLKEAILTIKDSGLKATAIVQDLLAMARRGIISNESININDTILHYINSPEHNKLLSEFENILINLKLDKKIQNIKGSEVHLEKAIMNIIRNAFEAQPHGGHIIITTETSYIDTPISGYNEIEGGQYTVLSIEDKGEGIDKDDQLKIFEPFYTKKKMGRSGSGLGMAVVWGTVKDHDGYITVSSQPDKGTIFKLFFPIDTSPNISKATKNNNTLVKGNGEKILIIDDLKMQQDITEKLLKRLNYTTYTVSSGEEAIEFLKTTPIDILILDMIMEPGIDGLETYKRILKTNPNQKAIVASGFTETEKINETLRLGAGEYLAKPFTIEEIGNALKSVLHS